LTVRSLPDIHLIYMSLLVLLLCLCKSFKELCLRCLGESSSRLAGAKVLLFSEHTKLFCNFFQEKCKKDACLDFGQAGREGDIYLIYIRTHERVALAAQQGSKARGLCLRGEQSRRLCLRRKQSPGAVPTEKQSRGLCLRRSERGGRPLSGAFGLKRTCTLRCQG